MLPAINRMRRSTDFASVVRDGVRVGGGPVVLHQRAAVAGSAPVVGLVISKAVGGSVVRHRVARRLRAQLAQRLDGLPGGSGTVVRAMPGSAQASSAELGAALDRALRRLAARQ